MRDKQQRKNPTNADLTRKETTELKRYKKYITPYLSAFVIGPLMMLTEVAGEVMQAQNKVGGRWQMPAGPAV